MKWRILAARATLGFSEKEKRNNDTNFSIMVCRLSNTLIKNGLANELISTISRLEIILSTLPDKTVGYSNRDLRKIEPLLVTPSITISVNPAVISFSILRIFVFKAFSLMFSLIIAISTSSEKSTN
jgi:hypothetical protein